MTVRRVIDVPAEPLLRPSARVGTVARILDDVPSQVRRMLANGDLEGHREGKRGVRIYLDSVQAWQKNHPVGGQAKALKAKAAPPAPAMRPATQAAHRQAVALLRDLGLV